MDILHFKYWVWHEKAKLSEAKNFRDLSDLALGVLSRIPAGIEMVSGPISTGGVGGIDGNRKVFEKVIETLILVKGLNIFSQMPFEDKMVELKKVWLSEHPTEKYCMPILHDFYEPIFLSGKIVALHFIHGWESSFGARWEHDNCHLWKITTNYLPNELSEEILAL